VTEHPAVEFLTAALDRAELAAQGCGSDVQIDYVVIHGPAAVLRQVAAVRKLLAEHEPAAGYPDGLSGYGTVCGTCARADRDGELWGDAYPCRTVLLLAQAWGWEGSVASNALSSAPENE